MRARATAGANEGTARGPDPHAGGGIAVAPLSVCGNEVPIERMLSVFSKTRNRASQRAGQRALATAEIEGLVIAASTTGGQ